jgi:hypothetical protein
VPAHLVLGADPLVEPLGDLSLAIFALAVPRLADDECALGEVDVLNPQGGDLAKAETGAHHHAQEVAGVLSHEGVGEGLELGFGEPGPLGLLRLDGGP